MEGKCVKLESIALVPICSLPLALVPYLKMFADLKCQCSGGESTILCALQSANIEGFGPMG